MPPCALPSISLYLGQGFRRRGCHAACLLHHRLLRLQVQPGQRALKGHRLQHTWACVCVYVCVCALAHVCSTQGVCSALACCRLQPSLSTQAQLAAAVRALDLLP